MQIRTVLCPVDFSGQTDRELSMGKEVCGRFGARLVVEHNLDPRPPNFLTVTWMWSEEFEGEEEQKLGSAQNKLRTLLDELSGTVDCEAKLTRGPIDEVLLLLVKELPADLLIMGSHGWTSSEHVSLTEKMIAKCPVPVLAAGQGSGDEPRLFGEGEGASKTRILVSVDDHRMVEPAVTYAASLAAHTGDELTLLEVLPPGARSKAEERCSQAEERLRQLLGETIPEGARFRAAEGEEVAVIVEEANAAGASLIVRAGHRGHMPWKAHERHADIDLLHLSPCPVLYVPEKYAVG